LAFTPKLPRPEPKKFVPPEHPRSVPEPLRLLPEASPLAVAPAVVAPLPLATAIPGPPKPQPREFVSPAAKPVAMPPVTLLEAAPNLPSMVESKQPSIVVVGLDPARTNDIPLPEGSRAARFSRGPDSGVRSGQPAAAILVPALTVFGDADSSAVVPPRKLSQPYHEPSSAEWAQAISGKDSRRVARSIMSIGLRPSARVIAPFVEARFPDRPVYTTSFDLGEDGSMVWVIWFAEQNLADRQYTTIRPPVPWARVAPDPLPSMPASRFEVAAVIDKNGHLGSITIFQGASPAAKETAARIMEGWAFLPALRNGEPITVDSLIEISFRGRP